MKLTKLPDLLPDTDLLHLVTGLTLPQLPGFYLEPAVANHQHMFRWGQDYYHSCISDLHIPTCSGSKPPSHLPVVELTMVLLAQSDIILEVSVFVSFTNSSVAVVTGTGLARITIRSGSIGTNTFRIRVITVVTK